MKIDSWLIRDDSPCQREWNWKDSREALRHRDEPSARKITCPECGMTSWHPKDVEEGWCGNCHKRTQPHISQRGLRHGIF